MKTPVETMFDGVAFTPLPPPDDNPENLPYATHEGVLDIGGVKLGCVVLNTGERLFTGDAIEQMISAMAGEDAKDIELVNAAEIKDVQSLDEVIKEMNASKAG